MTAAPAPQLVRPYGDRRDDGVVQLAFTLPLAAGERAREAAAELVRRMGLEQVLVASMERAADGFTCFVVYGRTPVAVDAAALDVPEVVSRKKGFDELNALVAREVGRRIVVLGACTGSDAHAVGIDAIMNMKGYAGDYGLERYPMFDARNLGAQVENATLARLAKEAHADAVLVSQVVTQRDVHKENARQLLDELARLGVRERVITLLGGPRIDHRTALELGFDAGFGPGTRPSDVANFLVGEVLRRMGKTWT
ncbi:OAM dimerization domain-containing protein [Anaeromyxobacter diazotrophicus]|uniref:L-beta-lysine 5,6-aminomutase beta subunit n=1 Tax=Anaeromyxobacter diazotrophicus TaxID=2590199 RepID=A0A7I9VM13_9BACT|nr:OAM dimerization domain-containing protein [Anaeromyxobacter diazotrophicus]GEJ57159.1 L-beta-lysine 5,6-aminomutase beta subunit [Anaeromyxobacter diazotrophicus]